MVVDVGRQRAHRPADGRSLMYQLHAIAYICIG